MQTNEILAGISDLKREFLTRTRTSTDISKLKLELFMDGWDLGLREATNIENSMAVAVCKPCEETWRYFLTSGTPAHKLIKYFACTLPINEFLCELNKRLH